MRCEKLNQKQIEFFYPSELVICFDVVLCHELAIVLNVCVCAGDNTQKCLHTQQVIASHRECEKIVWNKDCFASIWTEKSEQNWAGPKKGFFCTRHRMNGADADKKYKRQMSISTHHIIQSTHNCGAVSLDAAVAQMITSRCEDKKKKRRLKNQHRKTHAQKPSTWLHVSLFKSNVVWWTVVVVVIVIIIVYLTWWVLKLVGWCKTGDSKCFPLKMTMLQSLDMLATYQLSTINFLPSLCRTPLSPTSILNPAMLLFFHSTRKLTWKMVIFRSLFNSSHFLAVSFCNGQKLSWTDLWWITRTFSPGFIPCKPNQKKNNNLNLLYVKRMRMIIRRCERSKREKRTHSTRKWKICKLDH